MAAAALANLDVIEREGLLARVRELEPVLAAALRPLEQHALVAEVRTGLGLLGAVELDRPELLPRVLAELRARGVLSRVIAGRGLQASPAFVITPEEISTPCTPPRRRSNAGFRSSI